MSLLTDSQVKLRIPTELKQRIEAEAQDAKRSMNAEIVARLENSFNFKKLDAEHGNITLSPYQLLDRKKELSDRLVHAIQWANFNNFRELKYSHIAEQLEYETAEIFLDWVQGKHEPTFIELRKIAEFLGVEQDWLVHGDGYPTPHSSFDASGSPERDILELFQTEGISDHEIFMSKVKKIHFVRNISPEGELVIVREYKNEKVDVLETRAHISTVIGDGGRRMLQNFASLWAHLYDSPHRNSVHSYLMKKEKFNELRKLYLHPLALLRHTQPSYWWEEIWRKQPSNHTAQLYEDQWSDWLSTVHVASEGIKDTNL